MSAEMEKGVKLPFIVGVGMLWLLFWFGFIVWWALMSALFKEGEYLAAIAVAYALPVVYTLAAYVASRVDGYYIKLLHFLSFLGLTIVFYFALHSIGEPLPASDTGAYLGMAFIAFVMAVMQYPTAGLRAYESYKSSLFIGGVIFMPLFIYFAAMLPNVPHIPAMDKVYLFPLGMLGFWLSGAWLVSRKTHGKYVPGLEIQPLMPFRPDFILPGGVTFVKGVIMMGVGLMIAIMPVLGMPKWNWWGFVLAFWGIITLIPLRGMYKMIKGRRPRMLGRGGTGFKAEFYKDLILFVGLNIMLYGFVNAFFGTTPFLELGIRPEYNSLLLGNLAGLIGIAAFVASFLVLVPLRGWYKTRLLEGVETTKQMLNKQVLLYIGTLLLLISYIHLLNLPPIRKAGYMWFYPDTNPTGLAVGFILFLAGSILILIFRSIALKNEFEATVQTMVGSICDSMAEVRRWSLERRIDTLVAMPEKQRDEHVRLMLAGLNKLPKEKRELMIKTQLDILSESDSRKRRLMMASMDKVMFSGGT